MIYFLSLILELFFKIFCISWSGKIMGLSTNSCQKLTLDLSSVNSLSWNMTSLDIVLITKLKV